MKHRMDLQFWCDLGRVCPEMVFDLSKMSIILTNRPLSSPSKVAGYHMELEKPEGSQTEASSTTVSLMWVKEFAKYFANMYYTVEYHHHQIAHVARFHFWLDLFIKIHSFYLAKLDF